MCLRFVRNAVTVFVLLLFAGSILHAQSPGSPIIGRIVTPLAKAVETFPLDISNNQTSVLIFPAAIKSVDRGSAGIICKTIDEASNVLKVKAASDSLPPSNLNVFTGDGKIYSFTVFYHPLPAHLTLDFSGQALPGSWRPVDYDQHGLNEADIKLYSQVVADLRPYQHRPRSNRIGGARMQISGKYVQQGMIFLQFTVTNKSRLPLVVDFARCYIRDNKQSRRSSSMEKEIPPLYMHMTQDSVHARGKTSLVLAFDQFTIADNKHFSVELFEKGGDRNLRCKIKGRDILRIKPLLPFLLRFQQPRKP